MTFKLLNIKNKFKKLSTIFSASGHYLCSAIIAHPDLELAFVWNRSQEVFDKDCNIPDKNLVILRDLNEFRRKKPDLVVEVAHPSITQKVNYYLKVPVLMKLS